MSNTVTQLPIKLSDLRLPGHEDVPMRLTPDEILEASSDLPGLPKVWKGLNDLTNAPDGTTFLMPSVTYFAKQLGVDHRQFRSCINWLHEHKWIQILNKDQSATRKERYKFVVQKFDFEIEMNLAPRKVKLNESDGTSECLIIYNESSPRKSSKNDQAAEPNLRLCKLAKDAPPHVNQYYLTPFVSDIKRSCIEARDIHGKTLADFSDVQIKFFCHKAPDEEIAVALQEVNQFIPDEAVGIKNVQKALEKRFKPDDKGDWHLNPNRRFQLEQYEHLLKIYTKRVRTHVRTTDFHPNEETGHHEKEIEFFCLELAAGRSAEKGWLPLQQLKQFELCFEADQERNFSYVKLKPGYTLQRFKYGYWWITQNKPNELQVSKTA
jgi:hypothetical protein